MAASNLVGCTVLVGGNPCVVRAVDWSDLRVSFVLLVEDPRHMSDEMMAPLARVDAADVDLPRPEVPQ